jgi:biopolymer transport protein ExbB
VAVPRRARRAAAPLATTFLTALLGPHRDLHAPRLVPQWRADHVRHPAHRARRARHLLERLYVIVVVAKGGGGTVSERVIQLVRSGRPDDALAVCGASSAVVPDMGHVLLQTGTREEDDLQNVADAASLAVLPRLTRRLQYLPMLANVATLSGCSVTIYGLREAFASVALASAAERAERLAAGIAVALNATGFGLLVAIPLTVAHSYLASQAERLIEQVTSSRCA